MHLTVVICTHNRAVLLEKTLVSLNLAARPKGCFVDILVVANACSDGTSAFLDNYQETCYGKWLVTACLDCRTGPR